MIDAAAGGHRRMLIIGDPGIGKSTLMDAAERRLRAAGVAVLRASPSFAERHTAHSMLWDLLNDLDWQAATGLSDEYRSILEVALGRQPTTTELPTLATAIALENILHELSSQTPVVLLIDDLQWSDPESLAAVDRSVRRSADHRVSLVATSREYGAGQVNAPGSTFDAAEVHHLDGLTVDELDLLMRPRWPSTLTRAQVITVREHTGGNPMWALELIARGAIGDLGAVPVGSHRAPLPLSAAVADRLRTLGAAAADVVSIVALLGRPRLSLLADVLRFSGTPSAAIDEAETAGFLTLTTQTVGTRHPLHASAAAARLSPARRRELHAFIARAVDDPVTRAQHLHRSQPPGPDEEIAEALAKAAIVMRRRGARLRSAHFDAQAVARTNPTASVYQERLLIQAQNLFSAGDNAACARALSHVSAGKLTAHLYDAYLALSTSSIAAVDVPAAIAFLDAQTRAVAGNSALSAVVQASAVTIAPMTVSQRALASQATFVELADVDTPNAVHRALRGTIRSRLEAGDGLDHALLADLTHRQSIQIVVGLDDTGLAIAGLLAHQIDDIATSRRAFSALIEWARAEGKEGVEQVFVAQAAFVELASGDVAAARDYAERIELTVASPTLAGSLQPLAGLLLIEAGRHDDLAALVDVWRRSSTGALRELEFSALLGFSAHARRRWPAAVEHLRKAAQTADALGLVELGSRFRVDLPLIEALLHTGQTEEATVRVTMVSDFLAAHDRPISQIDLHRVKSLQLAASGDLEAALTQATLAVELAVLQYRPQDEARALLQRARVSRRLRRVTRARTDLEAARVLIVAAGWTNLLEQLEGTLEAVRPRRAPSELTAAEARVHALVQKGHSNKEIAANLYISVRTVESHVAAVLRKTGAPTRARLITRA